jgi:hypothetical protein
MAGHFAPYRPVQFLGGISFFKLKQLAMVKKDIKSNVYCYKSINYSFSYVANIPENFLI